MAGTASASTFSAPVRGCCPSGVATESELDTQSSTVNGLVADLQALQAQVERKIQSAFQRAASLDAGKIWVQTAGSVVTLRGTVRSWAEHQDAERAAWAVPGVTAVRNDLEIVVQELAEVRREVLRGVIERCARLRR